MNSLNDKGNISKKSTFPTGKPLLSFYGSKNVMTVPFPYGLTLIATAVKACLTIDRGEIPHKNDRSDQQRQHEGVRPDEHSHAITECREDGEKEDLLQVVGNRIILASEEITYNHHDEIGNQGSPRRSHIAIGNPYRRHEDDVES